MTKLNKAVIEAIVAEYKVIGQANLKLAEYFNTLGEDAPAIESVLDEKKAPAKKSKIEVEVEEEAAEEVEGNVIEVDGEEMDLDKMTIPQLKKLAGEFEIEVPAKGKDKIIAAILEGLSDFEEEDEDAEDEEDVEVEEVEEIEDTEDEEEEEEADEEEEEEIDLDSMGKEELLELAEELEVEVPKKKKTEKASAYLTKIRELLAEALEADEEVEEDEVEEDEEEEEDEAPDTVIETEDGEVDLEELSLKELKAFAKDYELEITAKKKDGIIAEILEQLSDDEEEEEEDDVEDTEEEEAVDLAEEYGLNDMEQEELAEILEEHGLSIKGKKQALVDRVLKAIEDGTIELEEEGE